MNIFVVIPVHNRKKFTKGCLDSLRKQIYNDFTTIVVDDGSTDGTNEMLKAEYPEVVLIEGDGNLWWTAATNLGIKYALDHGADYVMTLNDDTIAPAEFIERMVYWAKQKPNAVLGALDLAYDTKEPIYGGEIEGWIFDNQKFLLDYIPKENRKGIHEVSVFPGRGCWIPRATFEKIGLFDEKTFPHYMADFDFTHNAKINDFPVYCNFDAPIYTFPEESGDIKNRKRKTFKLYYNHLFSITGGGNLRNFTKYTFKNCPPPYIPFRLMSGYTRRLLGFWVK